jgi:hypothetical protein
MFTRVKKLKTGKTTHEYLQIVESYREEGKPRQRVIGTLGRLDRLLEGGRLDRLVESLAKFSHTLKVIQGARAGDLQAEWARDWGSVLVFERFWQELGLRELCRSLGEGRRIRFDIERAAFASVLQRIEKPGSDLACTRWLRDVYGLGFERLSLQHLYRAMDIMAEHKEHVERELFWQGRELFDYGLDLVFFDTTSVYFEGEGDFGFCERGFSRDHRPEDRQLVVGVLMSRRGYPVSCEFWPGNTTDKKTLTGAIRALGERFKLGRVILVCDRGMVSVNNLVELEEAGLEYIVGIPLRRYVDVREEVLSDPSPFKEVADHLQVKEVLHHGLRYIVCHNPQQAERDRRQRETIVENLKKTLSSKGPKALVGNRGYQRFLKMDRRGVAVNEKKITTEARFDGKFVLLTNTGLRTEEVALSYKNLWQVERAFSDLKSILEVRPVFHRRKQRIKGHIFCSFLALYLKIALQKALEAKKLKVPWDELMGDLRAIKGVKLRLNGSSYLLRTDFRGVAYKVFQAVGVRPPPTLQALEDQRM